MADRARILIVEDEQIVSEDLREILERRHFTVVAIADSGQGALDAARTLAPDVILMDIHLKGEPDGIETAKRIRSIVDIPVIYLTSSSLEGDLEHAKQTDPYGYITKPFDPQTLVTTIEIALHKHALDTRNRITLETYRFIAEYSASWEMWLDANGIPVYISPSCERITGYRPDEIHACPSLLREMVVPGDRQIYPDRATGGDLCQKNTASFRIRTRGGEVRWISHTSTPIHDRNGILIGNRISNSDITREKEQIEDFALAIQESNERYLLLTETMADTVIFVYDEQKGLEYINKQGASLLKKKPEDLTGKKIQELFTSENARDAQMVLDRFFATKSPAFLERTYPSFPGNMLTFEIWLFSLDRKGQTSRKVWGLMHDISEKRMAEKRLIQSLHEKDVLLKEIHHRVKNNLQQVASLLYLQEIRGNSLEVTTALRESRNRVYSMALVHEILIASDNLSQINLASYLSRLLQHVKGSYDPDSTRIRIKTEIDPALFLSLDECIPCGLIVNELVSNAMKHAFVPGTEGDITIRAVSTGTGVTLGIEDTGKGLPPAFDITKVKSLGLQLVTRLVGQLEGEIRVSGPPGTLWTITFPGKGR